MGDGAFFTSNNIGLQIGNMKRFIGVTVDENIVNVYSEWRLNYGKKYFQKIFRKIMKQDEFYL